MNEIIAFYNTENLFDTVDDLFKEDEEYLPDSPKQWTHLRYQKKVDRIASVINKIGGNRLPLLVGLAEVENKRVLQDLVNTDALQNNMDFKHFESDDHRGIDVALLYHKTNFYPLFAKRIHVEIDREPYFSTRDVLYVKGKLNHGGILHVFVNHWPSRRDGTQKSKHRRIAAAFTVKREIREIQSEDDEAKIIVMGDFNDYPVSSSLANVLKAKQHRTIKQKEMFNLAYKPYINERGTHHSKRGWSMFDQIIVSRSLLNGPGVHTNDESCKIFNHKSIMFYDKRYEQYRPNRTYRGKKYHGGYSDHLPIYFILKH